MKTLLAILTIACLGLFTTGCSSLPVKGKLFLTLEDTQIAVHNAMNEYGKLYRAGKVNLAQVDAVREAHAKYKLAFDAAILAAEFNYKEVTPEHVRVLRDAIFDIILTITK